MYFLVRSFYVKVMKFMDKVKKSLENITAGIVGGDEITRIIKITEDLLNSQLNISTAVKQTLIALNEYSNSEVPEIKGGLDSFSNKLEEIETQRGVMVQRLKKEFVDPLISLSQDWKQFQEKIKNNELVQRNKDKIKRELDKKVNKPAGKLKPNEVKEAEANYNTAVQESEVSAKELETEKNRFNDLRINIFKQSLNNYWAISSEFYQKSRKLLK
jgi:FAM92 protein